MYEGDIQLDNDGNSVLSGGEFAVTTDDSQFIKHMLLTAPGSWLLHPELGVGLQNFVGSFTNMETIREIRFRITDFFKRYGFYPEITLYYLDDTTLVCYIQFHILGQLSTQEVRFAFNTTTGSVDFLTKAEEEVSATVALEQPKNKYFRRR